MIVNTILFPYDTIAAVATPPGEGGLAIIRVSGPDALAIAERVFRPRQRGDVTAYAGYTTHYGQFVEAATDEVADDGLLTVFRAPRSFTGEDTLELSCHGGRATTARVLQVALDAGARLAAPGEFTQRAFLNGRMDLAQAEAVADVIRARTEASRRLARRQLEGALSQAIVRLKDEMIGILAAIEVTIDFSDEVGELDHAMILTRLLGVKDEIERLLQTSERGRILREGLRVAIVGKPNVGKSSLLNVLLGQERAIVTPVAGTTRDLVEETATIGGIPVVLVDTAGIRDTHDVVERIGVERAQNAASHADVVLFVLDAMTGLLPDDIGILRQLDELEAGRVVAVFNKCDLLPMGTDKAQGTWKSVGLSRGVVGLVHVSAQTGEGLDVLEDTMVRAVIGSENTADVMGESVVVANARHKQALMAALASLQEAEQTTRQSLPGDFIAIDLRGALDQLGLITGETVTEDIIHRIFHDFCVGK